MGRIYTVDKLRRSQRSGANRHAWAQLQNIRTHLEHVTGEDLVTLAMKKSLRITSLTLDLRLEQRELPFKPLGENAWKELREIEVPKRWQYPDDLDLPHVQADPELQSLALTNHIYDRLGCGIKEPFHDDSMMPFRRAGIEYIRYDCHSHATAHDRNKLTEDGIGSRRCLILVTAVLDRIGGRARVKSIIVLVRDCRMRISNTLEQ